MGWRFAILKAHRVALGPQVLYGGQGRSSGDPVDQDQRPGVLQVGAR
jgi:hypothetical protein